MGFGPFNCLYGISSITAFIFCDSCYLGCNSDDNVSDNIL